MQILNYPETEVWLTTDSITTDEYGNPKLKLVYLRDYTLDLTQLTAKLGIFIENKFVKFTGVILSPNQRISFKDGLLHSFDGQPALDDGVASMWMSNGVPHRICGPCTTYTDSNRVEWAIEGKYYPFKDYLDKLEESERIMVLLKYANNKS